MSTTSSVRPPIAIKATTALAVALFLGVCSFALNYSIAVHLDRLQVLSQYNVLFDADPHTRLNSFSLGWGRGGRTFIHPNLGNYTNPPIRLLAKGLRLVRISKWDEASLQRLLGMLLVPVASGLQTCFVFFLCYYLRFSLVNCVLVCLLDMACFSNLIFGSIPEHCGLTGCVMAGMFCLFAEALHSEKFRISLWTLCGALLFGLTITNVVPFVVLLFLTIRLRSELPMKAVIIETLKYASLAVGVALIYAVCWDARYKEFPSLQKDVNDQKKFAHLDGGAFVNAGRFPKALANTVAASTPVTVENALGIQHDKKYKIMFSYEGVALGAKDLLVLGIGICGAFYLARHSSATKLIAAGSIAVVAFNWILHTLFGNELILYSQHWQVPWLICLSGILFVSKQRPIAGQCCLAIFFAATLINNVIVMSQMLKVL